MQHLSHFLRKAVSTKKLQTTSHVWIALHTLSEHVDYKITAGYIKNSILFVTIPDHGKKLLLHRDKLRLLQKIQSRFVEYGYAVKIKDIRFM